MGFYQTKIESLDELRMILDEIEIPFTVKEVRSAKSAIESTCRTLSQHLNQEKLLGCNFNSLGVLQGQSAQLETSAARLSQLLSLREAIGDEQ